MAAGIEHRKPDTLLQAYQDYDCPNFSIWNGKRLCIKHDSGNVDEAYQALQGFVNAITASNTGAVYTLRVYGESVTDIKDNTPYCGSTTFMLAPFQPTAESGHGTVIMTQGPGVVAKTDPSLTAKIKELEETNKSLHERLHKNEIQQLREDFNRQIAGLNKEPEKSTLDRIFDFIERKPEVIKETLSGIGSMFEKFFLPAKDYIVKQEPGAVAGTNKVAENMESTQVELTEEGALVNPFITQEERGLKQDEQNKLLVARLQPLTQADHDNTQSDCLEIIEGRIGAAVLSRMLITVACMDNRTLNKLLSNLD